MKEILNRVRDPVIFADTLRAFWDSRLPGEFPYVKKAGNLVHLRTDFNLAFKNLNGRLWDLVDAHPTPRPWPDSQRRMPSGFIKGAGAPRQGLLHGFPSDPSIPASRWICLSTSGMKIFAPSAGTIRGRRHHSGFRSR
ncbi:MAG: hypothetical protein R2751_19380 [Bacteroidales bacterium]